MRVEKRRGLFTMHDEEHGCRSFKVPDFSFYQSVEKGNLQRRE